MTSIAPFTRRQAADHVLQGRSRRPRAAGEAYAPANIALCKYWGKRDPELNLPANSSLSVSLGGHGTNTRVEPADADRVTFNGEDLPADRPEARRLSVFLDLFRSPECPAFRLETRNTIPTAAGLASSASGFAALVLALDDLFGWGLDIRGLSVLARLGSGSAARSVADGFVRWHAGHRTDGMDSFAEPVDRSWPGFRVGLLVLAAAPKRIGSRDGMNRTTATSPLYAAWPAAAARDLDGLLNAIAARDIEELGELAEANALAMHATMIASRPSVLYWQPASVGAMQSVWEARLAGVPVYFTMDAGPNLKLLFEEAASRDVEARFPGLGIVKPFGD